MRVGVDELSKGYVVDPSNSPSYVIKENLKPMDSSRVELEGRFIAEVEEVSSGESYPRVFHPDDRYNINMEYTLKVKEGYGVRFGSTTLEISEVCPEKQVIMVFNKHRFEDRFFTIIGTDAAYDTEYTTISEHYSNHGQLKPKDGIEITNIKVMEIDDDTAEIGIVTDLDVEVFEMVKVDGIERSPHLARVL